MLKLPVIEFFIRMIPEGFLFVFANYSFSGHAIDRKRYIISSLLFSLSGYLIRLLPISFGVHTILNIIILIALVTSINRISLVECITSTIGTFIIMLISEMINVFIIKNVLKLDIEQVFAQPVLKSVLGLPSLLISISIIAGYYFISNRRSKMILEKNTLKNR
jgi:hypothetical protein